MTDPHALCAAMTRAVEALRWSMNEPDDAVRKAKAMEAVDEVRREMGGWRDIADAPPEGTVAVLYHAKRFYTDARTGGVAEPMGDGRDYGTMCDIGVFMQGGWSEAYTGHDAIEPWTDPDEIPTHYMPLPDAPPPPGGE